MNRRRRVRKISLSQLRRMIKEEAEALAAGDVEDVTADEVPWEDEKGVKTVDQLKAQGIKAESRMRILRRRASYLRKRLRETYRELSRHERSLNEARRRIRRRRRR